MRYTLPSHNSNAPRTSDYQGTTDDYTNDPDVAALKESVARNNAHVRETSRQYGRVIGTLGRVRVKGRGKRKSSAYHTNISEATHFDIYAGKDTYAMWNLQREIDTGLSPSQLAAKDKAEYKVSILNQIGHIQKAGRQVPEVYIRLLKDM